jgi:serine/threonine-protein kinase
MSEEKLTDRFTLYRFKLDRILGEGGTGKVYRGLDPEKEQVVAIKRFHDSFFADKSHIRSFAKSVNDFRKFDHQNVVKILEFVSGDDGACLVMEYVDGPSLRWYIENRSWDLQERLVIAAQVCNGLQYIHEKGYTHHDLKPGNVLFTRKGVVKLTDFSLSRERLFGLMGGVADQITPMYVSPELINKQKATVHTDIYSLGITFYYLFTEQIPFQVDNIRELWRCHLHVRPEHPSNVSKRCPKALGDIIMKMVQKDPAKRYDNCDELRIKISDIGRSRI